MEFCIDAKNLRSALKELEAAEKNGFMYCLAVFRFAKAGQMLDDNMAVHPKGDIIEKAHPTRASLDWGRGQSVTKEYRFTDGKLIPI